MRFLFILIPLMGCSYIINYKFRQIIQIVKVKCVISNKYKKNHWEIFHKFIFFYQLLIDIDTTHLIIIILIKKYVQSYIHVRTAHLKWPLTYSHRWTWPWIDQQQMVSSTSDDRIRNRVRNCIRVHIHGRWILLYTLK